MIHIDYWCDPAKQGGGWDHFVQVKPSYAEFASKERAEQPDISVMALIAKALRGDGWKEPTRYVQARTHWTGFHYLQGGHCWSHMSWVFNEDVASALDRGEVVQLTSIPRDDLGGWYRCTLCGLVAHDPTCPSCSTSCPVCEVIESEASPDDARWVSSNDHLRFGHIYDYGQPMDEPDEGPGDETTTDNVNELVARAGKHTHIARCVVFLLKGARDTAFRSITREQFARRTHIGASHDELEACAALHLHASERCLAKACQLTGGA